jgi:Zn-dependent peptidase ImmA (M78 family)
MKNLKVYGWDIPIIKKKGLMHESGFMAYYDPLEKTIVIDASLKAEEHLSTLIHEAVHAIFHRAGLGQAKISMSIQEVICEQVATVISENFSLGPKRKR